MGGRGGRSLRRGGERRRCEEGVAEGAVRPRLNGGKAAGALTAWSPWQLRGSFLPARLESLFLRVRWLEDAPERPGCGGGGGGGRVGSGAGVERRRWRRLEGPDGVNSPGGGGGRAPEGEAAAEAGSRLGRKPGTAGGCAAGEPARPRLFRSPQAPARAAASARTGGWGWGAASEEFAGSHGSLLLPLALGRVGSAHGRAGHPRPRLTQSCTPGLKTPPFRFALR
ncbi:hypothetical protein A6R68_08377, partial [Neotoma lepida]